MKSLIITLLFLSVLVLASCSTESPAMMNNTGLPSTAGAFESKVLARSPIVTLAITPSKSPSPPPPDPIGERIARMSDKELIGQMIMLGSYGTDDFDPETVKLIKDNDIGNIFLFGWNTDTFAQTSQLIKKVSTYNTEDIPLLTGIDLEGGKGIERFKKDRWDPPLLSAQKLGNIGDPAKVYKEYFQIGSKLKEVGININFAPVLDIAHHPSATFLNGRIFGSDPKKVSALTNRAIDGLHDAGVASLGKHFPGHGDSTSDPHEQLPVINSTLNDMESYYYLPFKSAIEKGVDAIMTAHVSYPNIDAKNAATVSPYFITETLRDDMGFKGVVVSDDLRMNGFVSEYPIGEGAVKFILAGGDMVLVGKFPVMQQEVYDSLSSAVQSGRITRERLEESVRRILELKQKYCGYKP